MLTVSNLNSSYGPAQILFDMHLTVAKGEVVALLGRNGAGKSNTFKSLMGLIPGRSGRIELHGEDISGLEPHRIARRGLGYVPEDRRVFTDLTVEENFIVGMQPPRGDRRAWTPERLYEIFPNLGEMRHRPGGRMSGGEQQMLTISRTLMGNPDIVLLDEPSEGLAPKIVEDMAKAILAMKQDGLAMVISEQNLHFSRLISDTTYIIEKGRVRFSGSMKQLDNNPGITNAYLAV